MASTAHASAFPGEPMPRESWRIATGVGLGLLAARLGFTGGIQTEGHFNYRADVML